MTILTGLMATGGDLLKKIDLTLCNDILIIPTLEGGPSSPTLFESS